MLDLLSPPYSTFFIMFLAFLSSLVTALVNRKFIDRRIEEWQREISAWNAEKELAKKTGDKKLMAKVKKQEIRIMQIRAKISAQQMKAMLITFVPFLLIWWLLILFYENRPVAFIPLLGGKEGMPFFFWYLICQFFFNFIMSKIFNVRMGLGTKT